MKTESFRIPSPLSLVALESVDSTNEEAKRIAANGGADFTVVWARQQTAGRGRNGREWVSKPGNLYMSILLRPRYTLSEAMKLSFVAAVSVADAVGAATPKGTFVTCKWPNDILVEGRKVAGVLLESSASAGPVPDWVVIGIGINIAHFPDDTIFPATSLNREGAENLTPERLLESVCNRFQAWLVTWRDLGFAPVRRSWLERAHGLGDQITVRLPEQTLKGTFKALDENGALILAEEPDGVERRILAGDVFFDASASVNGGNHAVGH